MKFLEDTKVYKKWQLGVDMFLLELIAPKIAVNAEPGQFVTLRAGNSCDPILRRPLGIADVCIPRNSITVIFRHIGKGTDYLSGLEKGDNVNVLGPLGKGFVLKSEHPLIIGGGCGLAPLLMLAKLGFGNGRADLIIGGRSKSDTEFWCNLFEGNVNNVYVTTDDGSFGTKGTVMAEFNSLLKKNYDTVYTCGPIPMMKAIATACEENDIKCQVSLERYMACGIGACLSCACENNKGNRIKVCQNGPVFWSTEVKEW